MGKSSLVPQRLGGNASVALLPYSSAFSNFSEQVARFLQDFAELIIVDQCMIMDYPLVI